MSYPDDFVEAMSQKGVSVDAGSLPDLSTLKQSLEQAWSSFSSLDANQQAAFDEITTNDANAVHLANPAVGVAPGLEGLLRAFDQAGGHPLSELLQAALESARSATA